MTLELRGDTIPIEPMGDMMVTETRKDLEQELQDPEFAYYYGADQAKTQLAFTLVDARGQLNLTQKEVADKLKVSQPYIAKLERGDANPSIGRIGSLLALLGLRLNARTEPLLSQPVAPHIVFQVDTVSSFRISVVGTAVGTGFTPVGELSGRLLGDEQNALANITAADSLDMPSVNIRKPILVGGTVE